jgi:hypothetical protein
MRRRLERDRNRVHGYHDDLRRASFKRLAALADIAGDITITYQVTATPGTVFGARTESDNNCYNNEGKLQTHFSFIVARSGDAALGFPDGYRWFSPANFVPVMPTNSIASYTVSLDPSNWIGVYGEVGNSSATALAAFRATLADMGNIGLVFGGGCFSGHGIYLDAGSATFNLLGIAINP